MGEAVSTFQKYAHCGVSLIQVQLFDFAVSLFFLKYQ